MPEVLLSGNHARIARWRRQQALGRRLAELWRRLRAVERRVGVGADEDGGGGS